MGFVNLFAVFLAEHWLFWFHTPKDFKNLFGLFQKFGKKLWTFEFSCPFVLNVMLLREIIQPLKKILFCHENKNSNFYNSYNKTGLEIRKVNSVSCSTPASRAKCQITLTFVTLMGDTLQLVLLEICLNFWLYPCCAQWVKLHSEGVILVFMHLCFHEIFKITSSLNIYEHLMNI